MKRIMVIGCCGAGKSTLTRQLHERTRLPYYHLDQHYWKPGWVESKKGEWEKSVTALAEKEQWIIDGNYNSTMDIRLKRAELVLFLDRPTLLCLWRVIWRSWKSYGTPRPDMPEGCPERFSLSFLWFVAHFHQTHRPAILKRLGEWKDQKQIITLKSNAEVKNFLATFTP